MNALDAYRRAQDGFEAVLAIVPAEKWHALSACAQQYGRADGAPGAAHPRDLAVPNPVETFRGVRAAADDSLTSEELGRAVRLPGIGEQPLASIITLLTTDHLAHTWDIGHALALDIRLDTDLIAGSLAWARDHVVRIPGFFGPELGPPPDADEQPRWLAYLGRAAWQPVPA